MIAQWKCQIVEGMRASSAAKLHRRGQTDGRKWLRRLMATTGLRAIHQKARTSVLRPEHRKYRYFLQNMVSNMPNQACCFDITYTPMH